MLNLSISLYFLLAKQTKAKPNQSTFYYLLPIIQKMWPIGYSSTSCFLESTERSLTEAATCVALFKFLPCVLIQGDINSKFLFCFGLVAVLLINFIRKPSNAI